MHNKINSFKLITVFSILSIVFSVSLRAEDTRLPQLANPNSIRVDAGQVYITDGIKVFIYSNKTFKLIKSFGKTGEGPAEFMGSPGTGRAPLNLDILDNEILVNSFRKVSFFTKDGKFIKELKSLDGSRNFRGAGKGFVGNRNMPIDNVRCRTINIYDSNLKLLHRLVSRPHSIQGPGGGFNPLEGPLSYQAYKGNVYVCWESNFIIRIFNGSGKLISTIKHPYKRRKVTDKDKKEIDHLLKTDPQFKRIYQFVKPLRFPETYPAVRRVFVDYDKIYIIARENENKTIPCFIFNLKGKLLKQSTIKLEFVDRRAIYPYTLYNGMIYQLIDNEEEEEWSLRVTALD